jgi:chromosome segregation ATPase
MPRFENRELIISATLSQNFNKLEGDVGKNGASIANLTNLNTSLTQKLSKIEGDVRANDADIDNLNDIINNLQNQVSNINESWVRNIYDSKIQDIINKLEGFKNDINKSVDQKLNAVKIDIGSNTVNLTNLGDTINRIQNQLSNINEQWVKDITDNSVKELVGDINNFKTEINNSVNDKLRNFELKFGDLTTNLKNEFISNINNRLNSEIQRLEGLLSAQTDRLNALLSPEQIKGLYESNPDTNVFTDAEKVKLAGIIPGANITDHDTVKAAGAVMEGDIIFGGDCAIMF